MALSLFATPTVSTGTGNTFSFAVDVGSGSSRGLLVAIKQTENTVGVAPGITTVTFNLDALTVIDSSTLVNVNREYTVSFYYIIAPDAGSNTLIGTLTNTAEWEVCAYPFDGANQSDMIGVTNKVGATSGDPISLSITTEAANSWIVMGVAGRNTLDPSAATSPATEVGDGDTGNMSYHDLYRTTTTVGSYATESNPSSSSFHSAMVVEVKEAAAGGGSIIPILMAQFRQRKN